MDSPVVFKNDGEGTQIKTTADNFAFYIQKNGISDSVRTIPKLTETGAPEKFKAEIYKDAEMFEGKHFIVFDTVDKGSGISRFEIKEGVFSSYKEAASPYVLENQNLDKIISIKVYDKNNNSISQNVYPENWKPFYTNNLFVLILIVIIGLAFYLNKRLK